MWPAFPAGEYTPWGINTQVPLKDRPEREWAATRSRTWRDDVSRFWDLEPPEQGFDENSPTIEPADLPPRGQDGWLQSGAVTQWPLNDL